MTTQEKTELVEDRELTDSNDDRLGHASIVDQLLDLVKSVPTPSNVALYGPWGSGKSGIGNLLDSSLKNDEKIKFARFDAFKYAENPLRRNFVSVVATALGVTSDKYHKGLYSGKTTSKYEIPFTKIADLAKVFFLVLVICIAVVFLLVLLIATIHGDDFAKELATLLGATIPTSLIPASLLTALIALLGKNFSVDSHVDKADSDEEFEKLLADLVKDSKAERVVIFVDELDRCAPDKVVATLAAVRTFLGVDRCVFVVAADQQVLEQALTSSLEQATPVDSVNPYYSAGSAYLDKVFQYQLAVPPLMPQSVTQYAVNLVNARPGVWSSVDVNLIASILIPSHVTSPRRVKTLLNAFVLAHRLAESRVKAGMLDADTVAHTDELARLVCLQVEFPLFYRDLVADTELITYVLALAEKKKVPSGFWKSFPLASERTQQVALEYSRAERAVDALLAEPDDGQGIGEDDVEDVQKTQGQQLLDYLGRTRRIQGPIRSLVYLQTSGSVFGLKSEAAELIERAAQDGSIATLRRVVSDLSEEDKKHVLELLIQRSRLSIGVEAENVASSILTLIAEGVVGPAGLSDTIAEIVGPEIIRNSKLIDKSTLGGVWQLSTTSARPVARDMGRLVVESALLGADFHQFATVYSEPRRAIQLSSSAAADTLVDHLFNKSSSEFVDFVVALPDIADRSAICVSLSAEMPGRLTKAFDAHEVWKSESATVEAANATKIARGLVADPLPAEPIAPASMLSIVEEFAGRLAEVGDALDPFLEALLKVDQAEARSAVEKLLPSATTVNSRAAVLSLFDSVVRRGVAQWPIWLTPIAIKNLQPQDLPKGVLKLVTSLLGWTRKSPGVAESDLEKAAIAIRRFLNEITESEVRTIQAVAGRFDTAVVDEPSLVLHQSEVQVATTLRASGLTNYESIASAELDVLQAALAFSIPIQAIGSDLAAYVIATSGFLASPDCELDIDRLKALLVGVDSCDWLDAADKTRSAISVRFNSAYDLSDSDPAVASAVEVEALSSQLPDAQYSETLSQWLKTTKEALSAVIPVVRKPLEARPSSELRRAVQQWRDGLDASEQFELAQEFAHQRVLPSPATLETIGLSKLPPASAESLIADRYNRSTNNSERRSALDLWYAARITDPAARVRLINTVLIPMIGLNAGAVGQVLILFGELAKPVPTSVKKRLGDALLKATQDDKTLNARAVHALEDAGYATSRGFLGKKTIKTAAK